MFTRQSNPIQSNTRNHSFIIINYKTSSIKKTATIFEVYKVQDKINNNLKNVSVYVFFRSSNDNRTIHENNKRKDKHKQTQAQD